MTRDHRDTVIETLALSETELLARIAGLEADVAIYRAIAVAGFHHAYELHAENGRLRRRLDAIRHELRRDPNRGFMRTHTVGVGSQKGVRHTEYRIPARSEPVSQVAQ